MSHELAQALAAMNLHRTGEFFWMSNEVEPSDEQLGIDAR